MEQRKFDLYLMIGIIGNILLVSIFVYFYFTSVPQESELKSFGDVDISKLTVYNEELDKNLSILKKTGNLPISIDPNEIGKQNPYNN